MNFWHVLLIGVGLYIVADAFFDVSEKISRWVRGTWGRVSGAVFGRPPARAVAVTKISPEAPAVTETARPRIDFGRAVANVTGFVTGLVGFLVRYWKPIALVLLALFILGLMRGCSLPFDWGKSKGELRLERELAEANTRLAQHETRLSELSRDLAVNSERDRSRVSTIISQANEDIDNAVEAVDPEQLYRVYRDAYDSVWLDLSPTREPNSAPRGSNQVRRPDGSPI